jgi:hypothetical protein
VWLQVSYAYEANGLLRIDLPRASELEREVQVLFQPLGR